MIKKLTNKRTIFTILLLALTIVPLLTSAGLFQAQTIEDLNKEIEKQKEKIEASAGDLDAQKQDAEELQERIAKLDEQISASDIKINEMAAQIDQTNVKIQKQTEEIDRIEKKEIPEMKERAANSLQFTQRNSNNNFTLEALMQESSLDDLIDSIRATTLLTQEATKSVDDLVTLLNKVKDMKADLEKEKADLVERKKALDKQKELLASQKDYQVKIANTLAAQIASMEQANRNAQDIINAQNEQKRLFAAAGCKPTDVYGVDCAKGSLTSSKGFVKPLSHAYISQRYGQTGSSWEVNGFHDGIDFATSSGTPVKSIAAGKVLAAGWSGDGGGNNIIVLHLVNGKNYVSRYCHLASINVSKGQTVASGQKIGAVGSTGNSTGPHLHMETQQSSRYAWRTNLVNPASLIGIPNRTGYRF